MNTLDFLFKFVKKRERKRLVVVEPADVHTMQAIKQAANKEMISPLLVGNSEKIKEIAEKTEFDVNNYEIVSAKDEAESSNIAARLVGEGKADFIMKGTVKTSTLLKAILNKEYGLRRGERVLSHVGIFEVKRNGESILIFLTDGGMNISPDVNQKISIIKNAIDLTNSLLFKKKNIFLVSGFSSVDTRFKDTIDSSMIFTMGACGDFEDYTKNVYIMGPVSLNDLFLNLKSSLNPDTANIFILPDMVSGNFMGKGLLYFAKARWAGIVVGAKIPIVLVSRADSDESKLLSICLGSTLCHCVTHYNS